MLKTVIVLAFVLSVGLSPKDISLAYKLRVGDQFELRQKTEQKIVQTIMGMEQTGNNHYDGTIAMRVISSQSGSYRIEAKMIRLKSHLKNFMNEIYLDSDGDTQNASNQIVTSMMNRPFYVTISQTGVIEKVENVDNLWAGIDKLNVSEEEKKKVKASIGQMINESSFKNGLGQAFLSYPTTPVQLQESWNTQSGIPADFPVKSDNKWVVETATSSQAVVRGDGVFKTTDKEKIVSLPGEFRAKVDLSGTQQVKGTTTLKTGLPVAVRIDGKMTGTILLLAGGFLPMDVQVPINIETQTDYTFVN